MADRLSPCMLSWRFALSSFSDYISLPVCVSMCVCSFVCICTQLGSSFRVSASFEHFFVYYTVNQDFIALPDLICSCTDICLFTEIIVVDCRQNNTCVYLHVLGLHVPLLVCLHYVSEYVCFNKSWEASLHSSGYQC